MAASSQNGGLEQGGEKKTRVANRQGKKSATGKCFFRREQTRKKTDFLQPKKGP